MLLLSILSRPPYSPGDRGQAWYWEVFTCVVFRTVKTLDLRECLHKSPG